MPEIEIEEETLFSPIVIIIIVVTLLLGIFILLWFEPGRGASTAISKIICGLISLFPFGNAMSILLKCSALTGG